MPFSKPYRPIRHPLSNRKGICIVCDKPVHYVTGEGWVHSETGDWQSNSPFVHNTTGNIVDKEPLDNIPTS